jgi:hypothetical protein
MVAKKFIKHKQLSRAALSFLCLFVALSFVAPLLPVANASSDAMPCCAGKAGHCDSGITPKRVSPPTSEPMCGLKEATMEDDGITIVAEPVHTQHSHSRNAETSSSTGKNDSTFVAESDSLSQPCRMDCGACATASSRQQKRERGVVLSSAERTQSPTTLLQFESQPLFFSSNEDWDRISPRGPPTSSQSL